MSQLFEVLKLAEAKHRWNSVTRMYRYDPYPYQKRFHECEGHLTPGVLALERALVAANKIGKTFCAAMEVAFHLTGEYPAWWKGHRFTRPVTVLCASNTYDNTRDIMQAELFGPPEDDAAIGTGTVPLANVGEKTRRLGVQNAYETIRVKHQKGWSVVQFKAYEQGFKKFMGKQWDVLWGDEEPPSEVRSQMVRATFARKKAILMFTFTPEEGMTEVVSAYFSDLQKGQALITATWDDAPHMTAEMKTERLRLIPAHERDLRSKGSPLSASGLIFPVTDDSISVEPFHIPDFWPRLNGMDFGWDHPFGAVQLAWDRDSDCIYLTNEYRESGRLPAVHVQAIKAWGDWVPTAWPHDGVNTEKGTGDELVKQYRDNGLNCLPFKSTNPPEPGKPEGSGGNSVEASLLEMLVRMETGRLKAFKSCSVFFEEKRAYHRRNGKIVKLNDDVISACRYGVMMIRFAQIKQSRERVNLARTRGGVEYLSARPR